MIKTTVMYGHPTDPDAFEAYYKSDHTAIVNKVSGIVKAEYTKFLHNMDGSAPAYYRMAELYFVGPAELQETMSSPEGQAMVDDLINFATGGVTVIIGVVEN
ncbi:MAG: EthD family reductase [Ferruginibacter sp.]